MKLIKGGWAGDVLAILGAYVGMSAAAILGCLVVL